MRRRGRDRSLSVNKLGLPVLLSLSAAAYLASAQPEPCSPGSMEIGYSSIARLNADMGAELSRIEGGEQPREMYNFNLCSDTEFDASSDGPILPVLDNTFIMCGPDGSSSNSCLVRGGMRQLEIFDSRLPSYEVGTVTIMGVEFSEFKNQSVSAQASSPATVNFRDTKWTVRIRLLDIHYLLYSCCLQKQAMQLALAMSYGHSSCSRCTGGLLLCP